MTNEDIYDVLAEWNRGDLQSYLIEITRDIFSVKDGDGEEFLVDKILDRLRVRYVTIEGRRRTQKVVLDQPGDALSYNPSLS